MTSLFGRRGLMLIAVLSALILVMGVAASDGFLLIDEFVYLTGVRSFYETGSFAISNGYDRFASDDLRLWLFVEGPLGLVPQYPVGSAVLGGTLFGLFGQKALIVLNVLAGVGTLFCSHALSLRLFKDRRIANLTVLILAGCTFWGEYVVSHWPHSISVFWVTAALWLFVMALEQARNAGYLACLSGLMIGLGLLFRLEVALTLLPFLILTLVYAARPLAVITGGIVGLSPMLGLVAWTNQLRFGTWNPLSYGSSGGGTDVSSYFALVVLFLLGLACLAIWRFLRPAKTKGIWVTVMVLFALLCLLYATQVTGLITRFLQGVHAILIDATAVSDPRIGVQKQPNGTQLFWGLPKKALAQSLPWLGALAILIGWRAGAHKRAVVIVLVFGACWALPFVMRSWHGGLGLNMRYLLPVLPPLASLLAWLILRLVDQVGWRALILGGIIGVCLPMLLLSAAVVPAAVLHQTLATTLFFAITAISFIVGFRTAVATTLRLELAAIGIGIGFAAFLAAQDIALSQERRTLMAIRAETAKNEAALKIPGKVVFYGALVGYSQVFSNPDQLLALPGRLSGQLDLDFLQDACADGYRIIMPRSLADRNAHLADWLLPFDGEEGRSVHGALAELDCQFTPPGETAG